MKKNSNNIINKTFQLIIVAFIAKGLGFLREIVLAYFYGTSYISDAFVAVQNIPAIIFTVFGVAVTTGFIPIYTEIETKKGKESANKFVNNVINIFFIISLILSILGIIFSSSLVKIFAGGFESKAFEICNQFAKIVMPSCIAIILVYVYNAYLQICGYFNQNFLMNVPYNVIQILFIVIAFYLKNPILLAIGCLLSSVSQYIYLKILTKHKTKFKKELYINFKDDSVRKMLILVGPLFISTGVNQINSIIDRALASGLVEGSVSALNYSAEVSNIVTQVIILSLTTILYPKMTKLFSENEKDKLKLFIEKYISIVAILVFPLSMLIYFFSDEIVQILFGRGAFDATTVKFVGAALKIYSIGIIGASFRDVLNKIFYSMKNTVIPMANGCLAVGCNIILNLILVKKYAYLGLAAATAISSIVCTVLLLIQLLIKMKELSKKKLIKNFSICLLATAIMYIALKFITSIFVIENVILRTVVFGMFACIVYLLILIILREEEICNLQKEIRQKLILRSKNNEKI